MKDLIAARLADGGTILFEVARRAARGVRGRRAADPVPPRGTGARDAVRRDRRVRRVPRRVPRRDPGRGPADVRARLPVRVARDPRGGPAVHRGAGLREPRARVRAAQPPLPRDQQALPPGRPRRGRRRVAGRSRVGGARPAAGAARVVASHGPGAREGHRVHAQLRRRADAVRPAVPRRRRRAHRAGDRRQGTEPRRERRPRAGRGRRAVVPDRRRDAHGARTRAGCCRACGARSTSRSG